MRELNEDDLNDIKAGMHLSHEDAKRLNKFKEQTEINKKKELTEEELEKYMGGINMNAEKAEEFTRSRE